MCGKRKSGVFFADSLGFKAGVALALKFLGSMKIFADPFESAKNNFYGSRWNLRGPGLEMIFLRTLLKVRKIISKDPGEI